MKLNNQSPDLLITEQAKIVYFTQANPLDEKPNQDSIETFSVNDTVDMLVVADGAGGLPCGEQASKLAIESIKNTLSRIKPGADYRSLISESIDVGNQAIIDLGIGAGTTLSIMLIENKQYTHFLVGDSLAICFGQKGKLKYQSIGHGPVCYAEEAGVITEKEALFHEDRNLLSNLMGNQEMFTMVTQPRLLSSNDRLLVASDGIWDNFYLDELIEMTRKGDLLDCAKVLSEEVVNRMQLNETQSRPSKPDDVSFILYQLNSKN